MAYYIYVKYMHAIHTTRGADLARTREREFIRQSVSSRAHKLAACWPAAATTAAAAAVVCLLALRQQKQQQHQSAPRKTHLNTIIDTQFARRAGPVNTTTTTSTTALLFFASDTRTHTHTSQHDDYCRN